MSYYYARTVDMNFEQAIENVTSELQKEGFGVLTEIDVKATLKKKLGVDFRPYRILGACNPGYAHPALLTEPHIGVMLPCNVVVQITENGQTEVFVVDPAAAMQAVENAELRSIALEIRDKLKAALDRL